MRYKNSEKIISGSETDTTNNRMELKAVIEGLKALKESCEVEIVSDSSYVTKGISQWLDRWVLKDFNKVKNPDLWKEYIKAAQKHKIKTVWVKGHNGHTENEKCDKIAKQEAEKIRNKGAV